MNSTISMNRNGHDHSLGSKCSISSEPSRSKELTDGQASAIVADPYLPLAVVAGAGCGKTFTLVRRVARVVASTGCLPSSVRKSIAHAIRKLRILSVYWKRTCKMREINFCLKIECDRCKSYQHMVVATVMISSKA